MVCENCIHYTLCNHKAIRMCFVLDKGCRFFKPIADVVEVKHGKWEYMPETITLNASFRCSCCKNHIWNNHNVPQEFIYCPNCGAKMK